MRIAAGHQLHFFPWLGFWEKLFLADEFVLFDELPFTQNQYEKRVPVLTASGPHWLTMPVHYKSGQPLRNVEFSVKAPSVYLMHRLRDFFGMRCYPGRETVFLLGDASPVYSNLLRDWNRHFLERCLCGLALFGEVAAQHERRIHFSEALHIQESRTMRIVEMCRRLKCDAYLAGAGSKNYLDEECLSAAGIRLIYQDYQPFRYRQAQSAGFHSGLSILDAVANAADLQTFYHQCMRKRLQFQRQFRESDRK